MSVRVSRSLLSVSGVLVLVLGCAKGQMGGEIGVTTENTDGELGGCEEGASTALLVDEAVPGMSTTLGDLITAIEGEHEASLAWRGSEESSFENVEVTPEAQLSTIHVDVVPLVETGRLIELTEGQSNTEGEATLEEASSSCTDRVAVDAQVSVKSDNGALDETFTVTFWTSDGVVAHSVIAAEPADFGGSFAVDVSEVGDHAEASQTRLEFALAFGALNGTLTGLVGTDNGEVATGGAITYARFPAESPCETGFLLPSDAALYGEVQQLLDDHRQYDFAWLNEDVQPMTIDANLGAICYKEADAGDGPVFAVQVETHVQLADDTIDGTWRLDGTILLHEDGGLSRVELVRQNYMALSYPPQEFAEQTGIDGVESEADALSFYFDFSVEASGQAPAGGTLMVLELTSAACEQESSEEPEPGEGAGSPGCQGTTSEPIRHAALNEASAEP